MNPAYGLYRLFGGKSPTSGGDDERQSLSTDQVRDYKGLAAYKAALARGADAEARGLSAEKDRAAALQALQAIRSAPVQSAAPIAINVPSFAIGAGGRR